MAQCRAKSGLTIIECLVYLSLLSFIATASMALITHLWQAGLQQMRKEQSMLVLYSAYDSIAQDLHAAPQEKNAWKVTSSNMIIWQQDKEDIGWIIDKKSLLRITGTYNKKSKKWSKKQTSLVAHLARGTFVWAHKSGRTFIQIKLSDEKNQVEGTVGISTLEMS